MALSLACLVLLSHAAICDPLPIDAPQKPSVSVSERKPAPSVIDLPAKDPLPKPVTVADVIKGLGLDVSKALHVAEPPGKLRELR